LKHVKFVLEFRWNSTDLIAQKQQIQKSGNFSKSDHNQSSIRLFACRHHQISYSMTKDTHLKNFQTQQVA